MSALLCKGCRSVFDHLEPSGQSLKHHGSKVELYAATQKGCGLCRVLCERLAAAHDSRPNISTTCGYQKLGLEWGASGDGDTFIMGFSVFPPPPEAVERLDRYGIRLDHLADFYVIPDEHGLFAAAPSETRSYPDNTGSQTILELAGSWITTCSSQHSRCNKWLEEPAYHPSRLLDLGSSATTTPTRLIEVVETIPEGPYATLSHRWGNQSFPRLLHDTIEAFKNEIKMQSLPSAWTDAIAVTRTLGVRYLWIDALCILQDSSEDWTKEAALMDRVYSNSFCNIAATGASDNSHGCFFDRDPASIEPCYADVNWEAAKKAKHLLIACDYWLEGVAEAPLNHRAWVVQERLLAPRVLHFGSRQVYWECQELEACEAFPDGIPQLPGDRELGISGFKDLDTRPEVVQTIERQLPYTEGKFHAYQLWTRIVIAFSSGALTVKDDKLPALAGIAKKMAGLLKDQYLAGLWKRFLVDELCWSANTQSRGALQRPSFRPTRYRAPSWSWASLEGRITPDSYGYGESLVNVLDAKVELASKNPFGAVKSGYLRLRGSLKTFEIIGNIKDRSQSWRSKVNGTTLGQNAVDIMLDDVASTVFKNLSCLPIKYLPEDDPSGYGPWLKGLILQPAEQDQERYSRIGTFFVPDMLGASRAFMSQFDEFERKWDDQHIITIG